MISRQASSADEHRPIVTAPAARIWLLLQSSSGLEQEWAAGTDPALTWPVVRGCRAGEVAGLVRQDPGSALIASSVNAK